MENEIVNKQSLLENITNTIKKNKKLFIATLFLPIIIFLGINVLSYYQSEENKKISERYIKAGIYLSSKDFEKSKTIYEEIILNKNKFYSLLALNSIIENNLELDSNKVLDLFEIIEKIKIEKEQKNLIKLKKALYLIKISRNKEGNDLLKELISDNSIWKNTAEELL
jgi:predicted negative regulator of RcsB-dependent stress response